MGSKCPKVCPHGLWTIPYRIFFSILQGTIWYSILKFKPMLKIAKMMNYTAMGVGNHDLGAVDVFILSNLLDRD